MKKSPKIGDERFCLEHISYKAWCDKARERGWNGDEDSDGLRAYCEPEEAATIEYFTSLDLAITAAKRIFAYDPEDSAFGAILIEHQTLETAHDDRGKLIRGCKPEWEAQKVYEVTSDGDVQEYAS
jgi:hypothetical protein